MKLCGTAGELVEALLQQLSGNSARLQCAPAKIVKGKHALDSLRGAAGFVASGSNGGLHAGRVHTYPVIPGDRDRNCKAHSTSTDCFLAEYSIVK